MDFVWRQKRVRRSGKTTILVGCREGISAAHFGESAKLDAVMASDAWQTHLTRGILHLDGLGAIRGATGELVMERMALWSRLIPA